MAKFDVKGFMTYLPLILTGAVGLWVYNKFFKKTAGDVAQEYMQTNSSTGDINIKKKYIEAVGELEPLVTAQHRDYANRIYDCGVSLLTVKNGVDEKYIQSIFKSSSSVTIRLVMVAFGLARRKAFNFSWLPNLPIFESQPKMMDDFMREHYPRDNFDKIYQPVLKEALSLDKYAITAKYGNTNSSKI